MTRSTTRLAAVLMLLAALAAGCGDDPASCNCLTLGPFPRMLESPTQAMGRFEHAYGSQDHPAYTAMLTADFSYRFSVNADPNLVVQYGTSWGAARDSASTAQLFDGFTNQSGEYVPGARAIHLTLRGVLIRIDPEHADSTRHYALAESALVSLIVDLESDLGTYQVDSYHSFRLVRGDAARLRPGQVADSTLWFLRRQDDLAAPLGLRAPGPTSPQRTLPASATTWGSIKHLYLQ